MQPGLGEGRSFARDPVGTCTISIGRTVGEGDFSLLVNLTWLVGEGHVNQTLAGDAIDTRVLPPILTAAVAMGLGWTNTLRGELSRRFGLRGVRSDVLTIRTGEPVRPGDTMKVWSTVLSAQAPDHLPASQMLEILHEGRNQHESTVITVTQQLIVAECQNAEPAAGVTEKEL